MAGPLKGIKVVEVAGLGAAPFGGMILSDLGAEITRVDRIPASAANEPGSTKDSFVDRGRRSIALNLKSQVGCDVLLKLVERADVLIEAFRPGVAERLGFGPDACLSRNPRLVYARMTGWGQSGPLSAAAGHDINYIAISGALHSMGHADRPPAPPLNLVGDYGGGGLLMALGVVCALLERTSSGKGQVVDTAMSDGSLLLMTEIFSQLAQGAWTRNREDNLLDGGAPFYGVYACADGKFVSIGAIEAQFFALLLSKCGITDIMPAHQWDKIQWPRMRQIFTVLFKSKPRDEWCRLLEGTDVCFAPVLSMDEAPLHPHNAARRAFQSLDGKATPAPAPRFSRTPGQITSRPATIGTDTSTILFSLGYCGDEVARFLDAQDVFQG